MFSAATKSAHPAGAVNYVENVFSTYLYKGTNANQTIINSIDLSGYGGLVWIKNRSGGYTFNHFLFDTTRGINNTLNTNNAYSAYSAPNTLTAFNSNGFSLGNDSGDYGTNKNTVPYASWTFRKQPKFFDVVTFTQSGTSGYQTINHNLGSAPGMILIKGVGQADGWFVYHRSIPTQVIYLNQTNAAAPYTLSNSVTSTTFNFNLTDFGYGNGATYVAYLFANDAGGFGTTGTDNVISCGSFTTDGSGFASVNLGYEPQWLLVKRSDGSNNWWMADNMRGLTAPTSNYQMLQANTTSVETSATNFNINATGFTSNNGGLASMSFIYMAIRRPMNVPTDATTVFNPVALSGNSSGSYNATIVPDLSFAKYQSGSQSWWWVDRLRGNNPTLSSDSADAEVSHPGYLTLAGQTNNIVATAFANGNANATWNFSRRPGFFDVVCYTGDGAAGLTQTHNLGVTPELMIVKGRDGSVRRWAVYSSTLGTSNTSYVNLEGTGAAGSYGSLNVWNNTAPTSTNFTVGNFSWVNASGTNYVTYLFATCAGVSKVGSYTGNGTTQAISCGFTGGARFVLIKRTDSTGDWYVYDTARGMTTLTDPYLLLNSTAAQSTTLGSVTTTAGGFTVNATILAAINTSDASYIFLAIA